MSPRDRDEVAAVAAMTAGRLVGWIRIAAVVAVVAVSSAAGRGWVATATVAAIVWGAIGLAVPRPAADLLDRIHAADRADREAADKRAADRSRVRRR